MQPHTSGHGPFIINTHTNEVHVNISLLGQTKYGFKMAEIARYYTTQGLCIANGKSVEYQRGWYTIAIGVKKYGCLIQGILSMSQEPSNIWLHSIQHLRTYV